MTIAAPAGIMNVYATPDAVKRRLGIVDESHDDVIWHLVNVASRSVEGICGREFYTRRETRKFNVRHRYTVFVDDLVSLETVSEDCDGDGVYERRLEDGDFTLYPLGARPTTPAGRPYFALKRVLRHGGGYFPLGIRAVEVAGEWGYRKVSLFIDTYLDNNGGTVTKASRSFKVDDDRYLVPGNTVWVSGEQIFVKSKAANVVSVERGVNETEAVELRDGDRVLRVEYPAEVIEATILLAVDRWRRRDGVARSDDVAADVRREIYDPSGDVQELLKPYVRGSVS